MNGEGDSAVVYASYFKDNFWGDLLYSYGEYEADVRRNTGLGTIFGATYTEGSIDGYTETGDPRSNTRFASQDFESFITRIGYQVNWQVESTLGTMRPQLRIGYGRENLNRDQNVAAALVPNVANNNTIFGIGQSTSDPGEGWLELGTGVSIELCENATLLIDYDGQFLRQDVEQAHFGSVKVEVKF